MDRAQRPRVPLWHDFTGACEFWYGPALCWQVTKAVLAAILLGPCAVAIAAPISIDRNDPSRANILHAAIESIDVIMGDFSLTRTPDDPLFEPITEDSGPEWISTDLDVDSTTIGIEALSVVGDGIPDRVIRAPEPPALATITLGLGALGLIGMIRRIQQERREQMKPLKRRRVRVPLREYGLSSPHFTARQ